MARTIFVTVLMALAFATPASADFTVTKTNDTNDGSCFPTNCSLRDAVIAANADAGADTIHLPAGHYTLTGAAGEDLAASGDLDVLHDLTVAGAGASTTVIDGNLNDRIFDLRAAGTHLSLSGLTLTRGKQLLGSAIQTAGAGLTLQGVNVTDNNASGSSNGIGAIYGSVTGSTNLTITDSTFSGNVTGGNGFIGYGTVALDASGDLTVRVTNSTFTSNRSGGDGTTGASGEGLFRLNGSTGGSVTIDHSSFIGNTNGGGAASSTGFGIIEYGSSAQVDLSINDSVFSGNKSGGDGNGLIGPIYFVPGPNSTLEVTGSTFSGNTTGGGGGAATGGGVYANPVTGNLTATFLNDTFSGNHVGGGGGAGAGGGIYMNPTGTATAAVTLQNVTIAGNTAGGGGGAGQGGGYYSSPGATTKVSNTIIAGNLGDGVPQNCNAPVTSQGHNIENIATCGFTAGGDLTADPLLGPIGDFGGPTPTLPPLPGSPAIDHGAGCPATDQRGEPRPFGAACDIGAYEFAPPSSSTGGATRVTQTSALLGGSVVPSLRPATFHFEYGKTTAYGSQSASQSGTGLSAIGVSLPISGLKPGTTYHYRLVATGDATTAGNDATFKTAIVSLSKLRLRPSSFRAAPKGGSITRKRRTGTNITYTVSSSSKTTFRVLKPAAGRRVGKSCRKPSRRNRHGRKCTRYVSLGTFSHTDKAGKNKVHFTGRVHRHKLRPGKYRLRATPRSSGVNGKARTAAFKIVR